ncbi:MAG: gamma-glutamyltransferase [Rhodospirillales bacterium]
MTMEFRAIFVLLALWVLLPLGAAAQPASSPPNAPQAARGQKQMVATANPIATQIGLEILRSGGNAVDAAIAVQLALNVVEPQASGIGGGGLLMYFNAADQSLHYFDGRETAPSGATPTMFVGEDGKPLPFAQAVASGRSVGVPGTIRLIETIHKRYGKLKWEELFQPAIRLAREGVKVSPRLADALRDEKALLDSPGARALFYKPDGTPKTGEDTIKNLALAETLTAIAINGPDAFYSGEIARDIVRTVRAGTKPGTLSEEDLAKYKVLELTPVCGLYRAWKVCGAPPVSSGGIAILQALAMLQRFDLPKMEPMSPQAVHLIAEASKLAFADRDRYVGDPAFFDVPVGKLLDPGYLLRRAMGIDPQHASAGPATPGQLGALVPPLGAPSEIPATSHVVIVDSGGNVLSFTTTIEAPFGSRLMTHGFLLNNELTDFSFLAERDGHKIVNRVEPGKRPRSSMSPTIVFDPQGTPVLAVGSAGGSTIIGTTLKVIVGVLDWSLDAQSAIDLPNILNRNGPTELEKSRKLEKLGDALTTMGHTVRYIDIPSGLTAIRRTGAGLDGGADARRDGIAAGD